MIKQDIYIEILELFDLLSEEECFKKYKQYEKDLLNNKEITNLINQYNEYVIELEKIDYEPYIKEIENKLELIKDKLHLDESYINYLDEYKKCNDRLEKLTKIIFDDILEVKKESCCKCE